jgi:hypothetical protein
MSKNKLGASLTPSNVNFAASSAQKASAQQSVSTAEKGDESVVGTTTTTEQSDNVTATALADLANTSDHTEIVAQPDAASSSSETSGGGIEEGSGEVAEQQKQSSETVHSTEQTSSVESIGNTEEQAVQQPESTTMTNESNQETTDQSQSEEVKDTLSLPDAILVDADPQFVKIIEKFGASSSWEIRAWARNILTESAKFDRRIPLDEIERAKCTQYFLGIMEQSISHEENLQQRMRFILILTKYLPNIFAMESMARGADKLSEQQIQRYNTLATFYHYWSTLSSTKEIDDRFNISKEFTRAYNATVAARVMSVL